MVDADGMGRAFPELQMVSFNILGQRAAPMVMCDEYGDTVLIESDDNLRVEQLARPVDRADGRPVHARALPDERAAP